MTFLLCDPGWCAHKPDAYNKWDDNTSYNGVSPRCYVCRYGHTYSKSMDQQGKVANPDRGQLNREMNTTLSAFAPENLASRDGFGSAVPRQPAHLHT